jgi:hypothetical protein
MSKTFFTRPLIDSYVNFPLNGEQLIKGALGGYELLTYDEFMTWWNDYPNNYNTRGRNERIEDIERYFDRIFKNKCTNVGEGYIENDITFLKSNPDFDALFAVNKKDNIILRGNLTIEQYQQLKSESVGGFIIVQKGECKKLPYVYSVNLICTNNVKGQLLLGAYLFIIKSNPELPQIAILELAHGYTNISGFISYSKLGFEKDLHLYGENCFESLTTLPMSNYWISRTTDEIIQFVTKDVELVISPEARAILNFYESNKNKPENQQKLGVLLNILYRMELRADKILEDLIHVYDENNYEKMQNFFGYKETDDLTIVFYNNNDYDQNSNIQKNNYPKIIAKLVNYYKQKIDKMILLNRNGNYKHGLGDIDCNDERLKYTKRCKTENGGKRQKTNKKHRHYKKKTNRNSKRKPNNKNKKTIKNQKKQKNKNY